LTLAGCTQPSITVQSAPIPLSTQGGVLTLNATVDGVDGTLPLVLDTLSPVSIFDDGSGEARGQVGHMRVSSGDAQPVPRIDLRDVQLFAAPLGAVGFAPGFAVRVVLGGDVLSRFAVEIDYRDPPQLSLVPIAATCTCALADACQAVFPMIPQGGTQTLNVGNDFFTYPASRVLLDACLEPLADPVQAGMACAGRSGDPNPPYLPSGIDLKVAIATGVPALLISASAYDRLRGAGAARLLLDASTERLRLPGRDDDEGTGLKVARAVIGIEGRTPFALVSQERYYGPCAELSRSRRQRRFPPADRLPVPLPHGDEAQCLLNKDKTDLPFVETCTSSCDDNNENDAPTPAVIELTQPMDAFVIEDTAPPLVSVNADVRRGVGTAGGSSTVEALVGTEVLRRLHLTIDYPGQRVSARCVTADCKTWPRFSRDRGSVRNLARDCGEDCQQVYCTATELARDASRCRDTPLLPCRRFTDPSGLELCAADPALAAARPGGYCPPEGAR
jgi:hypothetical protein